MKFDNNLGLPAALPRGFTDFLKATGGEPVERKRAISYARRSLGASAAKSSRL
jgi:hypothetical protein